LEKNTARRLLELFKKGNFLPGTYLLKSPFSALLLTKWAKRKRTGNNRVHLPDRLLKPATANPMRAEAAPTPFDGEKRH